MTPKEKFDHLITEKLSDTILFRPILMHFAARYIGKTYGEFASDYRVLVEANLKCMEDFDLDMVGLISDPYRETAAFGAPVSFPAENVPKCEALIVKSMEDVKQLKRPDVYQSDRTRDRISGAELFQKKLKGSVPLIGWIEGPLAEACDLAGLSEMLVKLMVEPDFVNALMDKCVMTAKDFAKAQIEAGCDIIGMGDAICSQIDQAAYDLYVRDRQKEIIDFIHGIGGKVKLHICGNITHLLTSIRKINPDIVDLDWQVNMDEAYEILGPDRVRCGNINPVHLLQHARDAVFEETLKLCEKEAGRPFICSAGCEIPVNTPYENLMAMRQASYFKGN